MRCKTAKPNHREKRNFQYAGGGVNGDVLRGVSETSLFAISQMLSTNAFIATATEMNWVEISFRFNLVPRSFIQSR